MALSNENPGAGIPLRPVQDLRHRVNAAILAALPEDRLDTEFTDALLFLLSLRLNRLTGGEGDMTFSARCHMASQRAPMGAAWSGMGRVIDLYCAIFRGEVRHCETAWTNHTRRRRNRIT